MTGNTRPVVVGVDGSTASWQAIHTAAWEAGQRRAPLVLAHGYPKDDPYLWYGWTPPFVTAVYEAEPLAVAMVEETAKRVQSAYPDLAVSTLLRAGTGSQVLVEASRGAALVVVGARGHGGFAGLSLGSVAAQTAAQAESPLIVVRPSTSDGHPGGDPTAKPGVETRPGPVVLGIDGSSQTDATIGFAFEEAIFRRAPVVVLHVWSVLPPHNLGPDRPGHYNQGEAKDEAHRLLAELMAGWAGKFPDVPVELRTVESMNPSYQLIRASADASLVVVGSRGRGGFSGLLLGSVGRDLVGHAESPVAVVH